MSPEPHLRFQDLIDELLVAGLPISADPLLTEHLRECPECERYLNVNQRVIAALGEFHFDMEMPPQRTAYSSVSAHTTQVLPGYLSHNRLAQVCCVAFGLFLLGSSIDIGAGTLLEAFFQSRNLHIRMGIVGFWIMPSFFILLLFPMLPLLTQREGRTV